MLFQIYIYIWLILLYKHNFVNQLYFNLKSKLKKNRNYKKIKSGKLRSQWL